MDQNNNFAQQPQQPQQQAFEQAPQHQQGYQQQPAMMQGQRPEKTDMDHWMDRLNHAAANTHTVTNQPGDAPWANGFFECFNPIDTCLLACCCPCVSFGRTHHRLHKDKDLAGFNFINTTCIAWYVTACFGVHCIGNILQRNEIRDRANPKLKGDFVTDVAKAWCCSCCDLIQQDKEAQHLMSTQGGPVQQQPAMGVQQMSYEAKN